MESIGWTVDSNGKLQEGKRPGTECLDFPICDGLLSSLVTGETLRLAPGLVSEKLF